jgi:putative nucleotidyltransferase with HDIG domain
MREWNSIFPELEYISDKELRKSVEKVWEEACERGGWTREDIVNIPFTLLVATDDISLAEHTRVVTNLARSIGEVMENMMEVSINMDYLIAGALLHDVGKAMEYMRQDEEVRVSRSGKFLRHPLSGMGLAMKMDIPEEICHMIAVHSREGDGSYRSPEAIIVHHADFITFESVKALASPPPAK